jgi:hypothetical protein
MKVQLLPPLLNRIAGLCLQDLRRWPENLCRLLLSRVLQLLRR